MLASIAVEYAVEHLSTMLWDELLPLLEANHDEVSYYKDFAVDPNREIYQAIDEAGGMRIYTARTHGHLVGYMAVFVNPSLHHRSIKMAALDVVYVDPSQRGTRVGVDLIRYAHDCLRAEGTAVIFQHVKKRADLNIGPLLHRHFGYTSVDEVWALRLDRED